MKIRFRSTNLWLLAILSIVLLVVLIWTTEVDLKFVLEKIRLISVVHLLGAATLLTIGALLAAVRLWLISLDIGAPLRFREALLALSVGQIAGAVTVQFFGQIVARSALLASHGISAPANIAMAAYERFAAVAVSGLMALGGAWYLFGQIAVDLGGGGAQFLRIVAGIVFAVTAGAGAAWGATFLKAIAGLATTKAVIAIVRNLLLTLAIQLATAGTYVIIATSISETTPIEQLLAASFVIMFAASMPISFSGWGVRELSAVLAFGAIGVGAPAALAISVVVGGMAFGAVVITAGIATIFAAATRDPAAKSLEQTQANTIALILKWVLPLAAATAVFFQIYIPAGTTQLNVNLADPLVILAAGLFLLDFVVTGRARWRFPWLNVWVVVATVVILLSYLHGYYLFGYNDWAFMNRLLGWFILLCYGMTGALIVAQAGDKGAAILARTFVFSAIGVVLLELALLLFFLIGISFPPGVIGLPISGFSQNRNAFSLLLLLAICALPLITPRHRSVSLAILIIGLWFAGSRAAFGTFAVLSGLMLYLRVMSGREFSASVLSAGTVLLAYSAVSILSGISTGWGVFPVLLDQNILGSSNVERFRSIVDALTLFLSHPLFGTGLGYYISEQTKLGVPLVIHSTPLWLLAETGVFGFAVFAVPAVWIFVREWKARRESPAAQVILLTLVGFAVMSSVHELLYQRALWLVLGLATALIVSPRSSN